MQIPTRPVIPGFFPDPSVCRVGETYYLASSSFEYAPGVPIHRSTDLRTWELVGNALDRPSQLALTGAVPSGGIFAPTLRHHGGRFWLITTNFSEPRGQLLVSAERAEGPWSDPVWFPDAQGIDPDLCWDEDGTCRLTWAGFDGRPVGIVQAVVDPATGAVLSEPVELWQGTGGKFPEGPHVYRINGFWYQLIAEGGTERGHAVTVARGLSPSGPFEPSPHNPLLTARGSDSPVQNAGHADLVQRPDGSWALVYHGVRVRGASPQWHVLGRETFASEVVWEDGWPRLGDPIKATSADVVVEELGSALSASWVAPGRFPGEVLQPAEGGWLLTAADPAAEPSFVGRRQEHLHARIKAEVDAENGDGGLELRIDPRHSVRVEMGGGRVQAVARVGVLETVLGEAPAGPVVTLELRVEPSPGHVFSMGAGPDEIVAGVVGPDGFTELGRMDGRYLSTEVAGGMTGRLVGLTCTAGRLGIRSLSYRGADDAGALSVEG